MKSAIIAFVPVLHSGYIKFFSKTKGDIFIFDKTIIKSFTHLTRDLRVLDPIQTQKALKVILRKRKIELLNYKKIQKLVKSNYNFIMPEDEISHEIADKYIKEKKVKYASIFLRWNKIITLQEYKIPTHRKITSDKFHRDFIKIAEGETNKSSDWWRQIASVIVVDGKVVLASHNHHLPNDHHLSTFGDPRSNFDAGQYQDIYTSIHSEADIIAQAANKGISLKDAIIYVTTFPCSNCARLIAKAGIKKLYYSKGYSLLDAEKILDHFGIEVFLVQ